MIFERIANFIYSFCQKLVVVDHNLDIPNEDFQAYRLCCGRLYGQELKPTLFLAT
jgi:hypothetical protein